MTLRVTAVRFVAASAALRATGLLGWCSFIVNGTFVVDGVAVRRTAEGRYALVYPLRTDSRGHERYTIRPAGDRARRAIERAVLGKLGLEAAA